MTDNPGLNSRSTALAWLMLCLGIVAIGFGWQIPSRFKSVPLGVLQEAREGDAGLVDLADSYLLDQQTGVASMLVAASMALRIEGALQSEMRIAGFAEENPIMSRWGSWDPFVHAALKQVPLASYSDQPGALGIFLSRPCREAATDLLAFSGKSLVGEILAAGTHSGYRRLSPVYSSTGRPLEATLLCLGMLAQGDTFSEPFRRELRLQLWDAKGGGDIAPLEDFLLDALSLARVMDWGQFKAFFARMDSFDTVRKYRYAFHRAKEDIPSLFALALVAQDPRAPLAYLETFGDDGLSSMQTCLALGASSLDLLLREQLPIERDSLGVASGDIFESYAQGLARFTLANPLAALSARFASFFIGAFLCFWGSSHFARFYRDATSGALAITQRLFAALASLLVLVVLSEPNLANGDSFEGYSFEFKIPVLAQVDGEVTIVETTPTTHMEPATLLSISFFFFLQVLVFLICMLKVREIDKRDVDSLLKLKLMENEDNLFDAGLYVGIAGTCISLVLQVLGLIDANLIAAYSSNLFGILSVAIVKIRLVRPYKNRLILLSEDRLMALSGKA